MKASFLFLLLVTAGTSFCAGCKRAPQSAATPADTTKSVPLTTIAFGSCNREDKEQPLWRVIVGNRPQLWIWLGDNVYGDTEDMDTLQAKYYRQRSNPGYQLLAVSAPIIGIWDDHDYGVNDGGKEYPKKKQSQQLMLDFLGEPKNSPRRKQAGAYASYTYGRPASG
jgi:alkaline phosphatase D